MTEGGPDKKILENVLNLDDPGQAGGKLTVKYEPHETAGDARLRQRKDLALFNFTLVVMLILLGGCAWMAFSASSTPEDKKWSTSILTAVAGALAGYLVKK